MTGANLDGANLTSVILDGAHLDRAILYNSNLQNIQWDEETIWEDVIHFDEAENVPEALREQLWLE